MTAPVDLSKPCPGQDDLPGLESTLIVAVPVPAGQGNLFAEEDES